MVIVSPGIVAAAYEGAIFAAPLCLGSRRREAIEHFGSVCIPNIFEPYDRLLELCCHFSTALGEVLRQVGLDWSGDFHWTIEHYLRSVSSMQFFCGMTIEQPGTDDSTHDESYNRSYSNSCWNGYIWLKRSFPQVGAAMVGDCDCVYDPSFSWVYLCVVLSQTNSPSHHDSGLARHRDRPCSGGARQCRVRALEGALAASDYGATLTCPAAAFTSQRVQ